MECVVYSGHAKSDCYSPADKTKLRCHDYQFTPGHHGAPEADGSAGRTLRFAGGGGGVKWVSQAAKIGKILIPPQIDKNLEQAAWESITILW